MAAAGTTTATLDEAMKTYYEGTFLAHFEEALVLQNMGQSVPVPLHSGKTVNWFRYHPFAKVTSALTNEGETGSLTYKKFEGMNVEGTLVTWNDQFEFSELLYLTSRDPFLARGTELIGQQAGESIELETLKVLAEGNIWPIDARQVNTSGEDQVLFYSEGVVVSSVETASAAAAYIIHVAAVSTTGGMTISNVAISDDVLNGGWVCVSKGASYGYSTRITDFVSDNQALTLDALDLPEVMQMSTDNNPTQLTICSPFTVAQTSAAKLDTKVLQKAEEVLFKNGAPAYEDGLYRAYIQPQIYRQLLADTDWVTSITRDQGSEGLRRNELGVWSKTKFMRGTTGARFATTAQTFNSYSETAGNVFLTLVCGRDSFGTIALEGRGSPEMNIKIPNPNDGNTENVNNLYGRAGWKLYWIVKPLNANFMCGIFSYA